MHPAEQIAVIIKRIYRSGMTTTSGGNLSIRDDNGDIWITPSAIDKGTLKPSDMIRVTKSGEIIGPHKPSSEYPFHRAIYNTRPEIRAIIHAHPPGLVAFSIAHLIPNTSIIPQARDICGEIGYAPYACPGSEELGKKISKVFEDEKYKAVILENHGVVLGGTDLMDAYQRFETLEFCCHTLINAARVGKINYLSEAQLADFHSRIPHNILHFMDVQHPSDERQMRGRMCEMIRRSCDQGLMISTYGTVSMRWRDNDFLITATNKPRWDVQREDIVQIHDGMAEVGKIPSRSVALHQRIYQKNPHINSIITTQTPNLMAFAVTDAKYDVRTIPESWIFLKDVPRLKFNEHYENPDKVADILSTNRAIIVDNDCFIVTGDALMQTFDYLEVAEFSAHSLIMASAIGELKPITDKEIEELRIAFNVK